MNKVILCEGATDAILLSYFLEKTAGWTYCRSPQNLSIKETGSTETINWYRRGGDYLLICGVGGKDNFGNFFEAKIKKPLVTVNAFNRIAVVTDHDNREIVVIEQSICSAFRGMIQSVKNNQWEENSYRDSFGLEQKLEMLLVVIPGEHEGALETVMLEAIEEEPYDKNIVEKSAAFTRLMRTEADRYISSDRLQLKAQLGVTWAIQYPEKVFRLIDEQIKSVAWEKSAVLRKCFSGLIEI